ncbi:MAG TPA: Hsp20 family protein [Firmicutes bacterium]|nr:Hsp20 family protein [Bacillota bacterium]
MKTYLQKRNNGDVFDVFEDFFKPMFYDEQLDSMRTDIKETDDDYKLSIEMPGFKKDEIKVSLDNGYLTVSAEKAEKEEEGKEKSAKYLRRECRVSCQRSYYVGDDVQVDSVKAKYDNGMLELTVPKAAPKKIETKSIAIE